ncbi:hypothetical protein A3Q56_04649 [Intoshia linei]|uniref:non-specific serine/threonine protein kinase n=1 Tax=Intoshia linei TaxID=1819745 RepID=A0A177B010_9BILA|nr:hypothetical protein A3Q56_04649 [Intoshia linei]
MSKKDADVYVILRYNGQSTVMNNAVTRKCTLDMFKREIVFLCKFTESQLFTIKWVDNDGDSITIYDDIDFEEAFRACVHDKMNILKFLVFDGIPLNPGDLCPYEKQHMHRRNAHRKTKRYFWIGHTFHGVRFSPNTRCKICNDRIWGLGYSGVYCENCPIRVHKNCYKKVTIECHVYKVKKLIDDLQTEKPSLDGDNLLAQFELIRVIGRGSYAKVMLVEHKPTKKAYAMKIIKKESLREPEDLNWLHTEKHVFEIATNHAFLVGLHSCFQNSSSHRSQTTPYTSKIIGASWLNFATILGEDDIDQSEFDGFEYINPFLMSGNDAV